jgi:hypothetical protein
MLKTDGYAVSVLLSKPAAVETSVDVSKVPRPAAEVAVPRGKSAKREQVRPPVMLDGKRVVGVDLGRCNLVSCAWKYGAGVPAFSRFANEEYQKKIGLREAQEKRWRCWAGELGLEAALAELPIAKTPYPFEMQGHLAKLLLILDDVLALNGLRRNLRFSQHCRRRRVMSEIRKRITSSGKGVVTVAFGGACSAAAPALRTAFSSRWRVRIFLQVPRNIWRNANWT